MFQMFFFCIKCELFVCRSRFYVYLTCIVILTEVYISTNGANPVVTSYYNISVVYSFV